MTDYRVVPDTLRRNVRFLYDAADAWGAARKALTGKELGREDLGKLGQVEDVIENHNDALDTILDTLREGVETLEKAGDSLNQVAKTYEAKDAEYYVKFGYMA